MDLFDIPGPIWGAAGIVIAGLIAAIVTLVNGHRDSLSKMVIALQSDLKELRTRVETLERERDAYRSWAHVLWFHIHDDDTPRTPAPQWPENLPR